MLPKAKETLKRVVDIRKLPKFIGKEPKNDMFKGGDMKIVKEKVVVPTFVLYKLIIQVNAAGEERACYRSRCW